MHFIQDLGDEDIDTHLKEGSQCGTYTSSASADNFLKCLSDHLINAVDWAVLGHEMTDMASRGDLAVFVWYVDSDEHEVVGSKGAETLCKKIEEVFREKK